MYDSPLIIILFDKTNTKKRISTDRIHYKLYYLCPEVTPYRCPGVTLCGSWDVKLQEQTVSYHRCPRVTLCGSWDVKIEEKSVAYHHCPEVTSCDL